MSTAYYVDGKRVAGRDEAQAILGDGNAHHVFLISDGLVAA